MKQRSILLDFVNKTSNTVIKEMAQEVDGIVRIMQDPEEKYIIDPLLEMSLRKMDEKENIKSKIFQPPPIYLSNKSLSTPEKVEHWIIKYGDLNSLSEQFKTKIMESIERIKKRKGSSAHELLEYNTPKDEYEALLHNIKSQYARNDEVSSEHYNIYINQLNNVINGYTLMNRGSHPYCSKCHGYEGKNPVIIHFWKDVNLEIASVESEMKAILFQEGISCLLLFLMYLVSFILLKRSVASKEKQSKAEIAYKTYYDALTELPNRLLFSDHLNQSIHCARRTSTEVGVLFIALDNFKDINASLGQPTGDLLLKEVTKRLLSIARDDNRISRLGGDEFSIIMEDIGEAQKVAAVAQRIINIFSEPFINNGEKIYSTVSIGIAIYPMNGETANDVLKNATIAMSHVKNAGKNNYHFFTETLNEQVVKRFSIETKLREALVKDEMIPYFQPKVDLKSGCIVGMEALVRWKKSDGTLVSPDEFIPVAEESGLIVDIDSIVLDKSCAFFRKLKDDNQITINRPFRMSVNFSATDFEKTDVTKNLLESIQKHGLQPEDLEVEITESLIMKNIESTIAVLSEIRKNGISISLDDFGTGYSSLSYLKRFPVNVLKIDKAFVVDLPEDKNARSIAKAIVVMAHEMDMKVIAEGVESDSQLDFIRSIGCDQIQGYIFSPPVPENKILDMLEEKKTLSKGR